MGRNRSRYRRHAALAATEHLCALSGVLPFRRFRSAFRQAAKVAGGALSYARQHSVDRIFCGHTHDAMHVEQNGIHYYNSGGWIDSRLTYITVDNEGVRIHEYNEALEPPEENDAPAAEASDDSELFEDAEYEEQVTGTR